MGLINWFSCVRLQRLTSLLIHNLKKENEEFSSLAGGNKLFRGPFTNIRANLKCTELYNQAIPFLRINFTPPPKN